jgi:hypothetical protein
LNGKPDAVFAPLQVAEFARLDCDQDVLTIQQGQTAKAFPQRLRPGQRIVWHVGTLAKDKDFMLGLVATLPERPESVEKPAAVRVLFNGKTVYYRMLEGRRVSVQAALPAAWSESMGDTVVVENVGKYQMAFDAVWIEELEPLRQGLTLGLNTAEKIPKALKRAVSPFPETGRRLYDVSSQYGLCDGPRNAFMKGVAQCDKPLATECALNFNYRPALVQGKRTYSVLRFLSGAVGFFHHGGTHLRISNILSPGGFASPLNGELNPEGYALWTLGQVLPRPETSRLHVNVTPPDECEYPLPPLYWIGALHNDGAASIMVVRNVSSVAPHAVQITASLPWSGPTQVAVRHGGCPQSALDKLGLSDNETLAAETATEVIELAENDGEEGGLFRRVFEFRDVLFVRLNRRGATFPEPEPYPSEGKDKRESGNNVMTFGSPVITEEDAGPFVRRGYVLEPRPGLFRVFSGAYELTVEDATPADIGNAEHVPPVQAQSVFIRVKPDATANALAEGISFSPGQLRGVPGRGKALSFWIRPASSPELESTVFGVLFGEQFKRVQLRTNRWQRVILPFIQPEPPWEYPDFFMFVVPPQGNDDGAGKENATAFEINGIAFIEPMRDRIRLSKMGWIDENRFRAVIVGSPGDIVPFRHRFSHSMDAKNIEIHGIDDTRTPSVQWYEKAQLLELSNLRFADNLTESAASCLSDKEAAHCRKNNLSVIVIIVAIEE